MDKDNFNFEIFDRDTMHSDIDGSFGSLNKIVSKLILEISDIKDNMVIFEKNMKNYINFLKNDCLPYKNLSLFGITEAQTIYVNSEQEMLWCKENIKIFNLRYYI